MIPERMKRINEACKEALGEILQEKVKDPRMGFATVTRVEVTPDLRQAKVWVSVMGDEEEASETIKVLEKASGFLRHELGSRVRIRYTPELKIIRDHGAEISQRVQGILHGLEDEEDGLSELNTVVDILNQANAVFLASHVNPDGDSIGSLIGLALVLKGLGKEVTASLPAPQDFPPQYSFLPGKELLSSTGELEGAVDVFVALDCSNIDRLGDLREKAESAGILINIDHHEDNQRFGQVDLVDKRVSSTSELVYRILLEADWPIGQEVATNLYTGLVTDTGRFQHRNTTPETFMAASDLAEAGADIFAVVREVYENQSLSYTHLLGLTLERTRVLEDYGLVYSFISQEDLRRTGAMMSETEDMIDFLRLVQGTRVVALFKELEDGKVRVSLRSRDSFEVGPVARLLGGGGHAMAAGYTSDLDLEQSLEDLLRVIRDARG